MVFACLFLFCVKKMMRVEMEEKEKRDVFKESSGRKREKKQEKGNWIKLPCGWVRFGTAGDKQSPVLF